MPSHKVVFVAPTAAQLQSWDSRRTLASAGTNGNGNGKLAAPPQKVRKHTHSSEEAGRDDGDGLLRWKVHRYLSSTASTTTVEAAPLVAERGKDRRSQAKTQVVAETVRPVPRLGTTRQATLQISKEISEAPPNIASGSSRLTATPRPQTSSQPHYSTSTPSYDSEEAIEEQNKENVTSSDASQSKENGSKPDFGAMGRARPVGISRKGGMSRPPILKTIRNHRLAMAAVQENAEQQEREQCGPSDNREDWCQSPVKGQSLGRPVPQNQSRRLSYGITDKSFTAGGLTTIESIPPPPPHKFALSAMTNIAEILAAPEKWLSEAQGGTDVHGTYHFGTLVLVTRIGALDKVKNWKAGAENVLMDRCEITVRDESGCSLRINFEDTCATKWTGPKDLTEIEHSSAAMSRYMDQSVSRTRPSMAAQYSYESAASLQSPEIGTSHAFESYTSSLLDTSAMHEEKMQAMLPIKAGDVLALSNLRLVRSRLRRTPSALTWRGARRTAPYSRSSSAHANADIDVFAVATPSDSASLELCWRNSVSCASDLDRNFDPDLVTFNARCRAIHRLAMTWKA